MATAALALAGQTALVTGGARRVGAEIVRQLHAAGATVAIHYRNSRADAQALAADLNTQRANSAAIFEADLLQTESIPALVAAVTARCGGPHILVNNASSFYPTPVGELTDQQWHELFGSNLKAPLFLAQAAAGELRRARGSIINIVDIHGLRPLPGYIIYSTAKAALIHLTKALARELAPEVRVNAHCTRSRAVARSRRGRGAAAGDHQQHAAAAGRQPRGCRPRGVFLRNLCALCDRTDTGR